MTDYETFVAAVNLYPPGVARWWLEEVLIRGTPEGGIGGAHVIIGAELLDTLGNPQRVIKGPYPLDALSVLTGTPAAEWTAVIGNIITQQQTQIALLQAQLNGVQTELKAANQSLASLTAPIE